MVKLMKVKARSSSEGREITDIFVSFSKPIVTFEIFVNAEGESLLLSEPASEFFSRRIGVPKTKIQSLSSWSPSKSNR